MTTRTIPRLAAAMIVCGISSQARAGNKLDERCVHAAELVQVQRDRGELVKALETTRSCMLLDCPAPVREDCTRWGSELHGTVPTIVIVATNPSGVDILDVTVRVDGVVLQERIDGRARRLDPGPHRLRFTSPSFEPLELDVLLREGEKMRPIEAVLKHPPQFAAPSAISEPRLASGRTHDAISAAPPNSAPQAQPRIAPWILSGVGTAALASAGILSGVALHDLDGLEEGCGRTGTCPMSEVNSVRNRLWIADGLLVGGLGAWAVAGYLWLTPERKTSKVWLRTTPSVRAPGIVMEGSF